MRRVEREQREDQGNSTNDPESSRSRKLEQRDESSVEKELELEVDLRIEGIAQDVILKDEERMGKIQEVVVKLRKGSYTKSIREDLGNPQNSMRFSEESSRIIHEVGNIDLYELGQMTRSVHCHSCWKHLPEGLAFCSCGVCLPYNLARINRPRSKKHGENQWQQDHLKAMDVRRGAWKHGKDRHC